MYRILMLSALAALAITSCKPTPRTALAKQRPQPTQQAGAESSPATQGAAAQATAPGQAAQAAASAEAPAAPEAPTPIAPAPQAVGQSLLSITSTQQDFSRARPWEKESASTSEYNGVYLGGGRVLTLGNAAHAATYVEIALPDGSRSVPARVVRYDRELNLALLAPVHDEDLSIFDTRAALILGEALRQGDTAAFEAVVRGTIPVRIDLQAESNEIASVVPMLKMPRLSLRAAQPLPDESLYGLPILRDGKLVGLSAGGNSDTQSLYCLNAELIARFLAAEDGEHASCPMVGLGYTGITDPVFRAYLKLADTQGGLYVNEVLPGGAAEQAGMKEGDVIIAIDGLEIDMQGRVRHPLYGTIGASAVIRSLKPMGETMTLSISRQGEKQQLNLPLNRDAIERSLIARFDPPGTQPRYVMWGGLLFQPMTQDYMTHLLKRMKGSLPIEILQVERREKELLEQGITELVLLTQIIPTPATLSYDNVGYCLVESVNGKAVHNFAEFVRLLDEPTPDGLVALGLNKAPYTIYVDRRTAEAANSHIRRHAIQQLRQLGEDAGPTP